MSATYTTDTPFLTYFVRDQAPIHMALSATLAGAPTPYDPAGFTYADFGCGDGLTLTLLAAANPDAHFIGIDINPDHIAAGRALAAAGEMSNVAFIEADFTSLAPGDLPQLNYAAVSGIYAWLEPHQRSALVDLISQKLAPGGLAYVQYTALPAGAMTQVLGTMTRMLARDADGDSQAQVVAGLGRLSALLSAPGLQFNAFYPKGVEIVGEQAKLHPQYLAHDVLNTHPSGLWHHQVASDFAARDLVFFGQAKVDMNCFGELANPDVSAAFAPHDAPGPAREEVIGLLSNRNVRADLFGPTREQQQSRLGDFDFYNAAGNTWRQALVAINRETQANLESPLHLSIMATLAEGVRDGAALANEAGKGPREVASALSHLVGRNLVAVGIGGRGAPDAPKTFAPTPLDRHLLMTTLGMAVPMPFPARQMGSCLYIAQQDRIMLAALISEDLESLWQSLQAAGVSISLDPSGPAKDGATFARQIEPLLARFAEQRLPTLIARGMLTGQ